jgi:hypothetical protein
MALGAPFQEQASRRQASNKSAVPIPVTPLPATSTTILTVPASLDFWITHLWVANTTGAAVNYTVHFVPSGGSASNANMAVYSRALAAATSEIIEVAINHRLTGGSSIVASASSASAINIGGWGYLISGEV